MVTVFVFTELSEVAVVDVVLVPEVPFEVPLSKDVGVLLVVTILPLRLYR